MKDYLIDTHAHIDMLEESVETTLQKMADFGVKKVINPACDAAGFAKILEIADKFE